MEIVQGVTLSITPEGSRIKLTCPHRSMVVYAVPADRSWVCTPDLLPVHALGGFFKSLLDLQDPKVIALMRDWGLYCRELPLEVQDASNSKS